MSKAVLMELKQIRDVRHDNLNQFIGACVEPNNVLIITQYASKGSLQVCFPVLSWHVIMGGCKSDIFYPFTVEWCIFPLERHKASE